MAGRYEAYNHNSMEDYYSEDDDDQIPSTAHLSTSELRALAQTHLRTIEDENTHDTAAHDQAQAEIAKYTKTRSKSKPKPVVKNKTKTNTKTDRRAQHSANPVDRSGTQPTSTSTSTSADETNPALIARFPSPSPHATDEVENSKGPKLRSSADVLDRLRWDPSINLAEYTIGYLERFEGIKQMQADAWKRESTDEEFIPLHRIKWVKRTWVDSNGGEGREEIVWDREARVDKLFGSGGTRITGGMGVGSGSDVRVKGAREEWDGVSSVDGGVPLYTGS